MKPLIQQMHKVKDAIKFSKQQSIFLGLLLILQFIVSCKATSNKNVKENYEIIKSSVANGTYLNIQLYDFYDKTDSLPGFINVNGIYVDSDFEKFHHVLKIEPGKYNIKGYFISKEPSIIDELDIDKNDSVVVRLYMKDSSEIIWD